MLPGINTLNGPAAASDEIKVRRAPEPEAGIVSAARAWALAFEAKQRDAAMPSEESAELALYAVLADVDELKQAELALYKAVIAADLIGK